MCNKICMYIGIVFLFLASSCATVQKKTCETQTDSVRLKLQEDVCIVFPCQSKKIYFEGSYYTQKDNSIIFEIEILHWFNNWRQGWTEFSVPLEGSLLLYSEKQEWKSELIKEFEFAQITNAKLRYKDNFYEDQDAIDILDRRLTRIQAYIDWLVENPDYKIKNKKDFEKTLGSVLFPEVYGYSTKNKKDYESDFEFAEGIKWNKAYTVSIFPDHFHEIRNSGTMYRDWIESLDLIYFLCMWRLT